MAKTGWFEGEVRWSDSEDGVGWFDGKEKWSNVPMAKIG